MDELRESTHTSAAGRFRAPPYVSYKTFTGFLEGLGETLPSRIDRSLMSSMSGGTQSHLQQALRATGLVTEEGVPTERLRKLHGATGDDRRSAIHETVRDTYAFLWIDPFDLQTTTSQHLDEQFREKTSATGATVERCVNFFKAVAQDAGIELSPHVQKARRRKVRRNGSTRHREKSSVVEAKEERSSDSPKMTHTVSLRNEAGSVTISFAVDWFKLNQKDQRFVLGLVAKMKGYGPEKQTDSERPLDAG